MKEEEEEVDVDSILEDETKGKVQNVGWSADDEDILWAEEEPDDDIKDWTMHIIMEDDSTAV